MKFSFVLTAAALHVVSVVTSAQGILAMWSCHSPFIIPWSSREYLDVFKTFMHACMHSRSCPMQEAFKGDVCCILLLAHIHLQSHMKELLSCRK